MGQTIACANQKGGVGKTTTVVNLATYLALDGQRVLVIDLDSQGNTTSGLGIDKSQLERSIYDAIIDSVALEQLTLPTAVDGLSIIPATLALAGAEVELAAVPQRERRLKRLITPISDTYDLIFLDCPPSLGLLTVNALTAATSILIPIQCEYYALEGLAQLIATINLVRDHLNPTLVIQGVVLTMVDPRTNLSNEVSSEVRRHLGEAVYDVAIPRNVRLSEAPSYGLPIALYRSDSKGAEAYQALAREFLARVGATTRPNEASAAADTGSPTFDHDAPMTRPATLTPEDEPLTADPDAMTAVGQPARSAAEPLEAVAEPMTAAAAS